MTLGQGGNALKHQASPNQHSKRKGILVIKHESV